MASILDKIQTIGDYQRANEEFEFKKQKALADKVGNLPATLQVANAIKTALDAGDVDTANRIMQVHRSGAYGVNTYGDPGAIQPQVSPQAQPTQPQGTGILGLLNSVDNTVAPQNPGMTAPIARSATPTAGVADVVAANAAKKKGAEEQAQKNVQVVMNPQIAGGEADARNVSDAQYKPGIAADEARRKADVELSTAPAITSAKKTAELNAESINALNKKADSANLLTGLTQQARTILQRGNASGSGAGAIKAGIKQFAGVSDANTQDNAALDVISGNLTGAIPRMEGPQSDADREYYKQQAGRVGDRSVPIPDRLRSLDAVDAISAKYKNINSPQKGALEESIPDGASINVKPSGAEKAVTKLNDYQAGEKAFNEKKAARLKSKYGLE